MKKFLFFVVVSSILFGGCISQEPQSNLQEPAIPDQLKESAVKDRGEPFSVGPSTPPSAVGPTSLPQAQAVTKDENIRLTLPLKTDLE